VKRKRKRYDDAVKKLAKVKQKVNEARVAMQLSCRHEEVAEIPYRSDPYGHNHTPPRRVCVTCGFAEEGWSCGYQILTSEPTATDAEQFGRTWPNRLFVVSTPWRATGKKPRNKSEAYEMAVRETLPQAYVSR